MMLDQSRFDEEDAGFWFHSGSGDGDQYFQTLRRTGFAEPEKKLMLAILDDALRCREKYLYAKDRRGKKLFREAEEWLLSEEDDWVFSFSHVCEVLGYNPSYLRKAGCGRTPGVSRSNLPAVGSKPWSTDPFGGLSSKRESEDGNGKWRW
jgi:hypothetical protein